MFDSVLKLLFSNKKFNQLPSEQYIKNLTENLTDFGISWVHLGYSSVTINEFVSFIRNNPSILPARTGHLGNWQEILRGRSSALDHTYFVCKINLGYAYITDFTLTESKDLTFGDSVYLPASIVENGNRKILPLYYYNENHQWTKCSEDKSYFCPLICTVNDNSFIPLTQKQRDIFPKDFKVKYISDTFGKYKTEIKKIFTLLLAECTKENSKITPNDLVDRTVSIQGELKREKLKYSAGKFHLGDCEYKNIEHLADEMFESIFASTHLFDFIEKNAHKKFLPFLSLPLMCVLDYIVYQYENHENINNLETICYFEWGAFGSAGYPPRSKGYYSQKFPVIKQIYKIIRQNDPHSYKKLLFILIPSTVFNLLPNSLFRNDENLLNPIFQGSKDILNKQPNLSSDILMKEIETFCLKNTQREKLSWYFNKRFASQRTIQHEHEITEIGDVLITQPFANLTFQLASMILGFFAEERKK